MSDPCRSDRENHFQELGSRCSRHAAANCGDRYPNGSSGAAARLAAAGLAVHVAGIGHAAVLIDPAGAAAVDHAAVLIDPADAAVVDRAVALIDLADAAADCSGFAVGAVDLDSACLDPVDSFPGPCYGFALCPGVCPGNPGRSQRCKPRGPGTKLTLK